MKSEFRIECCFYRGKNDWHILGTGSCHNSIYRNLFNGAFLKIRGHETEYLIGGTIYTCEHSKNPVVSWGDYWKTVCPAPIVSLLHWVIPFRKLYFPGLKSNLTICYLKFFVYSWFGRFGSAAGLIWRQCETQPFNASHFFPVASVPSVNPIDFFFSFGKN